MSLDSTLKTMVLQTVEKHVLPTLATREELTKTVKKLTDINKYLHTRIETISRELTETHAVLVDVQTQLSQSEKRNATLQLSQLEKSTNDDEDFQFDITDIEANWDGYDLFNIPESKSNGVIAAKRQRKYDSWEDRMRQLLDLEATGKLIWDGDTMQLSRSDADAMFRQASSGKSIFQFKRCYGKKGDKMRFDVTYKSGIVKLTHRGGLTKDQLKQMYAN
tara:strand:- start:3456 stop:4115 length:660 start_codon:yes stop_codon:yes gene_type:complete